MFHVLLRVILHYITWVTCLARVDGGTLAPRMTLLQCNSYGMRYIRRCEIPSLMQNRAGLRDRMDDRQRESSLVDLGAGGMGDIKTLRSSGFRAYSPF